MKETEFTSNANNNTSYDADNTIEDVISSLQESSKKFFKLFSDNQMKRNIAWAWAQMNLDKFKLENL